MDLTLREDQLDLVSRTSAALRKYRSVLMQSPTGSGKTVMASHMIGMINRASKSAWFICHRTELVEGSSKTFMRYGFQHSYIAAGLPFDARMLLQVCSIDTLKGRLDRLQAPAFAFIDECHHSAAAGWDKVIQWLIASGTRVIGLSATPCRADGSGLDKQYEEMILGAKVSWLIEQGFLSQYRYFAPSAPDVSGVHKRGGEFITSELDIAVAKSQPQLTGDIIHHWRKLANGMLTIGFARSIAHSEHMAQEFNSAGIPSAHLDGNTDKNERKRVIHSLANGDIRVVWNRSLFGEGFDLSAIAGRDVTIDCIIDAAPTSALSWKKQKDGRALRPKDGKVAIIIDHAGNDQRHGYPDDDIEWELTGSKKKKSNSETAPPPPITCGGCFMQIRRPIPENCPHCGKEIPKPKSKPVTVADGELVEKTASDREEVRKLKRTEIQEAKTLQELVALYATHGYKNPQKAAFMVWSKRPRKSA
jgi:DNA repair protein RadD